MGTRAFIAAIGLFTLAAINLLAPGALAQLAPRDYTLGAGDVVKISVFQHNDLATEARVSESGSITFPLVGVLRVAGLSASEVESLVARRLREGDFVVRPQVTALILQFKSLQVSVLGQVGKPGKYVLERPVNRLTEVIALAGGVTPLGADTVTLIRDENGSEKRIEIDLPELLQSGDVSRDAAVRAGDIVFVPRYPVFYVYGEVQRPGQYRLERDMTVRQAVAAGGGLTPKGTERGMRVDRKDAGKTRQQPIALDATVRADDVIYVRESLF